MPKRLPDKSQYQERVMTTMTRFIPLRTPFEDVAVLQNRLNSIFNEFSKPAIVNDENGAGNGSASFVPPVDVYEDAQQVVLKLEVPGVKLEDLDIRLENQRLTIKGERKFESEEKAENFHRIERRFGSFVRSFTLPQTVDTDAVNAAYDAGVLTINLAKKAEAKPKQVKIEVGSAQGSHPIQTAKQVEGSAS
jgi:HSP20 family protein